MRTELTQGRSWWKRNWKWFFSFIGTALILFLIFIYSGFGGIFGDLSKAYADPALYENALKKAQQNTRVMEVLGTLKSIDKLAILEGEVQYSNTNKTVHSTIRVKGNKGKAKMDISAERVNNRWEYKKINIRIKKPPEKKETIEIIKATD